MLSQYKYLAILIGALAIASGSFAFGVKFAKGQEAQAEKLVLEARQQAELGAADAIAQIKINNTTIQQKAETITREVPVYRDCRHDPAVFSLLNDALTGRQPASNGELPRADTAH